jgi:predicted Zn-ribbon and HTH transcriptional regulator
MKAYPYQIKFVSLAEENYRRSQKMNFFRLKRLRDDLDKKVNKSKEEEELLKELVALGSILDKADFSLSLSGGVCKACGQALK